MMFGDSRRLHTPTGPVGVFSFLDVPVDRLLGARDRLVLLHGVQDPGNVGTIIRAAHAFDAGVVLSGGLRRPLQPQDRPGHDGFYLSRSGSTREVESAEFSGGGRGRGFRGRLRRSWGVVPLHGKTSSGKLVVRGRLGGCGSPRGGRRGLRTGCRDTVQSLVAKRRGWRPRSLLYEAYMRLCYHSRPNVGYRTHRRDRIRSPIRDSCG